MAVKYSKEMQQQQNASGVIVVRNLFLWCMAAIYFFAFGSLYYQIPGLYGDNGILPVKLVIDPGSSNKTLEENFASRPTLVWLAPVIGLDVQHTVELVALMGVLISFLALLSRYLRNAVIFGTLWILYMSLYQVGQTFTWFQWDILLLEAGFLTVLVAPLRLLGWTIGGTTSNHTWITLWLVRWLLFRLMFAAGVVKLTSLCPTWWQLTALNYHFESQCIPTPLAWYAHHLPEWFLKLGVAGTFVIEIAVPFLFFIPIRSLRLFSFYCQLLLQVLIMLTGNYNFFNLLTVVLCVSLLDDNHLTRAPLKFRKRSKSFLESTLQALSTLVEFGTYSALAYFTVVAFSIRVNKDWSIHSQIAFTSQQFHVALEKMVQVSIYLATVSLFLCVVSTMYRAVTTVSGLFTKAASFCACILYAAVAFWIFCISMVPHTIVDANLHTNVWPVIRKWHNHADHLQLVNSYGLFRRMTGVGGRPEVIVEGSNALSGPWKEYHFLYKPGDMSAPLPLVAPHQPRLDWQMWFAALDSYQHNPWFVNFVHRLLVGQPEVLDLLDVSRNPFPGQAPTYIRAIQYLYSYTPFHNRSSSDWWTRKKFGNYLPPLTKDHPSLKEYLQKSHLIQVDQSRKHIPVINVKLQNLLQTTRTWICRVPAPVFLWTALLPVVAFAILL